MNEKKSQQIYLNVNSPGANISSNNFLLTPEGDLLFAIDENGNRNFIYKFEKEKLCTPPLITPESELFIATKNYLYCLKPQN